MDHIFERIVDETGLSLRQVESVAGLLDDGNTVPFIARYRKEATGGLDENEIRWLEERIKYHRSLEQRKDEVIRLIEEQGRLNDELEKMIRQASKLVEVEDLYLPFRPKRKTRASAARDNGLQGLADYLLTFPQEGKVKDEAVKYLSEQVAGVEDAVRGAQDIIAEQIAEDAQARGWIRDYSRKSGVLQVAAKDAGDRKSTRLNSSHEVPSRMPSSA